MPTMKIQTISYQKVFPLGKFVNERIGLEATVSEREDVNEAYLELKKIVEETHQRLNPTLEGEYALSEANSIEKDLEKMGIESTVSEILNCQTIEELEGFKLMAKSHPAFEQAFTQRREQLTA